MVPRAQRVSAITPAVKKAQKAGAAAAAAPGPHGGGSGPAAPGPAPARSAKLPALKKGSVAGASTRGGGYDMVTIAEEDE